MLEGSKVGMDSLPLRSPRVLSSARYVIPAEIRLTAKFDRSFVLTGEILVLAGNVRENAPGSELIIISSRWQCD